MVLVCGVCDCRMAPHWTDKKENNEKNKKKRSWLMCSCLNLHDSCTFVKDSVKTLVLKQKPTPDEL